MILTFFKPPFSFCISFSVFSIIFFVTLWLLLLTCSISIKGVRFLIRLSTPHNYLLPVLHSPGPLLTHTQLQSVPILQLEALEGVEKRLHHLFLNLPSPSSGKAIRHCPIWYLNCVDLYISESYYYVTDTSIIVRAGKFYTDKNVKKTYNLNHSHLYDNSHCNISSGETTVQSMLHNSHWKTWCPTFLDSF